MVFSKLNCEPRWRERLPEVAIPALVVHGRRDTFFPVGNGEALAREIPGARLLHVEQTPLDRPRDDETRVSRWMIPSRHVAGLEFDDVLDGLVVGITLEELDPVLAAGGCHACPRASAHDPDRHDT